MAATYSSFMTTRFYSPVFNTALFDGPLRIYFSQSYETHALKIYHLFQVKYESVWNELKLFSNKNKSHVFFMIYPNKEDFDLVFGDSNSKAIGKSEIWEEGLSIGVFYSEEVSHLDDQLDCLVKSVSKWMHSGKVEAEKNA